MAIGLRNIEVGTKNPQDPNSYIASKKNPKNKENGKVTTWLQLKNG